MINCKICSNKLSIVYECENCFASWNYNTNKLFGYNINGCINEYIYFDSANSIFLYINRKNYNKLDIKIDNFDSLDEIEKYNIYKNIADNFIFI